MKTIGLFACLVGAFALSAVQTPRDPRPAPPAGSAIVEGRIENDRGNPITDAMVVVLNIGAKLVRSARSDNAGRYAIDELPSGRYMLLASAPGYQTTSFGGGSPTGPGPFEGGTVMLVLADGERFDASMTLSPVSVLSGTVVDEYGLPAIATVSVLMRRAAGGRGSPLTPAARVLTGRDGRYRIEGLPANEYLVRAERPNTDSQTTSAYVAAFPPPVRPLTPATELRRIDPDVLAAARQAIDRSTAPAPVRDPSREPVVAYRPTYYPGVPGSRIARPVRVQPGSEITGIDLQLQLTRGIAFDVNVRDRAGHPPVSAATRLLGEDEAVDHQGVLIGEGRFQFTNVPPGRYVLAARGAVAQLPESSRAVRWGSQEIFVDAATTTWPALTLESGARIAGRALFTGTSPMAELARPPIALAELIPIDGHFTAFGPPNLIAGPADADAAARGLVSVSFESVAPGRYLIVSRLSGAWSLRSAMLNGVDVSAVPFDVRAGDDLKELVLTFTDRPASLTGTIKNESGEPVYAHTLVVFPADRRARYTGPGGRVRVARPDSRGRYEVSALPAGEYLVSLARDVSIDGLHDETLTALEAGAIRITLVEGKHTVQDLLARTGAPLELPAPPVSD